MGILDLGYADWMRPGVSKLNDRVLIAVAEFH